MMISINVVLRRHGAMMHIAYDFAEKFTANGKWSYGAQEEPMPQTGGTGFLKSGMLLQMTKDLCSGHQL